MNRLISSLKSQKTYNIVQIVKYRSFSIAFKIYKSEKQNYIYQTTENWFYLPIPPSYKLPFFTLLTPIMQSIIPQGKVHFYQYMEVELLQSYIQKGLTYFINALLNSSSKLINLRYYCDQIVLLINFLKDFYYMKNYKATYAEYFFGLERQTLNTANKESKPSKLRLLLNTAIMTVIPYLVRKIDTCFNDLKQREQNEGKVLNAFQKLFTLIYPYLYALFNTVQVLMKLRFLLFQKVQSYDFLYKMSNVTLNYMEEEEGATHYPFMEMFKTPGLLSILIGHKVLTWYFNQKNFKKDSQRKIRTQNIYKSPVLAMNQGIKSGMGNLKTKLKKNSCPICGNMIENATVVKQTGHVYCYECIAEYVKEHEQCPLTNVALSIDNLQLIYSGS